MKENKELKERVNKLEERLQIYEEQNKNLIKGTFIEIDNPWSDKTPPKIPKFCYILKNSNYLAVKDKENGCIYAINSQKNLKKGEKYKIQFLIYYPKGEDFQVGFWNPSNFTGWIKQMNSICFSNEGLFIKEKEINTEYKIKDNQKIKFIVDLSGEENFFEFYINGIFINKYNFVIKEDIFALAAIRAIGNSVDLKIFKFI